MFALAREDRAAARALVVLMTSITLKGALRDRVGQAKAEQKARFQFALEAGRTQRLVHREVDILTRSAMVGPSLSNAVGLVLSDDRYSDGRVVRDEFVRALRASLMAKSPSTSPANEPPLRAGELFSEGAAAATPAQS